MLDIKSLYTSILHNERIEAWKLALDTRSPAASHKGSNTFDRNDTHKEQVHYERSRLSANSWDGCGHPDGPIIC